MEHWTMAAAVALMVVCALTQQGDAICPFCMCPASYDLVCARRVDNGVIRGFSSRCVLNCTNKCRPASKQFVFVKKGRCGKLRPRTKPAVGAKTTTTTPATNRVK